MAGKASQMSPEDQREYKKWMDSQEKWTTKEERKKITIDMQQLLTANSGSLKRYKGNKYGDECDICNDGGKLLCCDYCCRVNHSECLESTFNIINSDDDTFMCYECILTTLEEEEDDDGKDKNKNKQSKRSSSKHRAPSPTKKKSDTKQAPVRATKRRSPAPTVPAVSKRTIASPAPPPPLPSNKIRRRVGSVDIQNMMKQIRTGGEFDDGTPPLKSYEGNEHDDFCCVCFDGGDLSCCGYCKCCTHTGCLQKQFPVDTTDTEDGGASILCHRCIHRAFNCGIQGRQYDLNGVQSGFGVEIYRLLQVRANNNRFIAPL
jgi:hypothetical protein